MILLTAASGSAILSLATSGDISRLWLGQLLTTSIALMALYFLMLVALKVYKYFKDYSLAAMDLQLMFDGAVYLTVCLLVLCAAMNAGETLAREIQEVPNMIISCASMIASMWCFVMGIYRYSQSHFISWFKIKSTRPFYDWSTLNSLIFSEFNFEEPKKVVGGQHYSGFVVFRGVKFYTEIVLVGQYNISYQCNGIAAYLTPPYGKTLTKYLENVMSQLLADTNTGKL